MKSKCQKCFEILGVKSRFEIFNFLKDKTDGVTVGNLARITHLRQPTVTFHLNEMEKNGILKKKRIGKEVFCILKLNCVTCPLLSE